MWNDIKPVAGFHAVERDGLGTFLWTQQTFWVRLLRRARCARLAVCYYGDDGALSVQSPAGLENRVALCRGWHTIVVRLNGAVEGDVIDCRVMPIVCVSGDSRELGIMVREIGLFDEEPVFERLRAVQDNLRLNQQEYRQGRTTLDSAPPALRLNLEARCNIPETSQACAYCAWDWAKEAEHGSPAFTQHTLDDLGGFYARAVEVNDCSIGEPTMHKAFGSIVARMDHDGKRFLLTTNGQLLTPERRREILGKNLHLYVSIDSATAAGYARYRNDRFDDVLANLKALCHEKKAHENLPRVCVSFIVMRSNVTELPDFFKLMREADVDEIKLRSLYLDDNVAPDSMNNGYQFDYAVELLTAGELAAASELAQSLARQHGIALHVEWERFVDEAGQPGAPACSEPWRTLYVLRRGIMPCCYATEPIARWDQRQGRPLAEFLREVFNGPAYQEIRAELAAGRLADFCRNTPSCPVLKARQQQGLVVTSFNEYQRRAVAAEGAQREPALPLVPLEALTGPRRAA